jgi:hypothetical protein
MQNLGTLQQLSLGDLADDGREERGKIMPSLMASSLRWRTHSARTNMTSEGLGEVFKGDSLDMFAGKFPLVLMGGQANSQASADGERGPPSARAELKAMIKMRLQDLSMPEQ